MDDPDRIKSHKSISNYMNDEKEFSRVFLVIWKN